MHKSPKQSRNQPNNNNKPLMIVNNNMQRRIAGFWAPFAFGLLCFIIYRVSLDNSRTSPLGLSADDERMMKSLVVKVSPIVAQAIRAGKAVVALESTVVTHGG